jgi:tRNA pseudouridine55 synthase
LHFLRNSVDFYLFKRLKKRIMNPSLDGGFLIDKPAGVTSHDVVVQARRILSTKRIGHTGTLDPFATGLMILCVGNCTRLSRFLTDHNKSYRALMRFGFATDTQDLTGTPLSPPLSTAGVTEERLRAVAAQFTGPQMQTPPMFSAKKIDGVTLHHLARLGRVVVRAAVPVEILSFTFVADETGRILREDADGAKEVECDVTCSAGTYIRTLAHDIGERLGCGAHLTALRRTSVNGFSVAEALTPDELERRLEVAPVTDLLIPPSALLRGWTRVTLSDDERRRFQHGQAFAPTAPPALAAKDEETLLAVQDAEGAMLGVGRYFRRNATLRPQIVFPPA